MDNQRYRHTAISCAMRPKTEPAAIRNHRHDATHWNSRVTSRAGSHPENRAASSTGQ
ncbi:hypothetical protein BPORC_1736 [Bifidobacterium porcinum]|nr:hypothetical protein BPORC_1736 [Bifidobacterium porcinum]